MPLVCTLLRVLLKRKRRSGVFRTGAHPNQHSTAAVVRGDLSLSMPRLRKPHAGYHGRVTVEITQALEDSVCWHLHIHHTTIHLPYPEGPARHLDASRQKLTPHCLAAIFDSQLPSPKLSLKMLPKLPLPHNRGHFFLFQNCPRGEGDCAAKIVLRQFLPRGIKMPLRALWVRIF